MPPLPAAARDVLQAEVDRTYGLFVDLVARNRGIDPKAVRAQEAGLFFGADAAIAARLADAKGSYEVALADMAGRTRKRTMVNTGVTTMTAHAANTSEGGVTVTTADIVDLDAVRRDAERSGRAAALQYVAEVNELCMLAGRPGLAGQFIADQTAVAEVRKALLEARAASTEGHISTAHGVTAMRGNTLAQAQAPADWGPIMARASAWRRPGKA